MQHLCIDFADQLMTHKDDIKDILFPNGIKLNLNLLNARGALIYFCYLGLNRSFELKCLKISGEFSKTDQ